MKQAVYISNATRQMNHLELQAMLEESRSNNLAHGITGVLCLIYDRFIQCIEGDNDKIDQLLTNIKADERNTNFTLLSDKEVNERSFPDWSMGFRTYSVEEFANEPGFFNLDDADYLSQLEQHNSEVIRLMKSIYHGT